MIMRVAADCTVGNRCILANSTTPVTSVDDFAIIGGMPLSIGSTIIGAHVMVGAAPVARDSLSMSLHRK